MTALELHSDATASLPALYVAPVSLQSWAEDVQAIGVIVDALWGAAGFIPDAYLVWIKDESGRPVSIDEARTKAGMLGAILMGKGVNLDPMQSLQNIDVIKGRPALRAVALRALTLQSRHEMWVAEANSSRATVSGRRRGSTVVESVTWDMDRARKLGLAGRDQWRNQPQVMLVARATAELARRIAPDAILGLPYSVEELGDDDAPAALAAAEAPPATPPVRRTARRAALTAAVAPTPDPTPDPEFVPVPDPEPVVEETPEPELVPTPDPEPTPEPETPSQRRRRAAATPPPAPEPEPEDDPVAPDPETPPLPIDVRPPVDSGGISAAQRTTISELFARAGLEGPAARTGYVVHLVGRPIASPRELSFDEAGRVIAALEEDLARDGVDEPLLDLEP